MFLPKHCVNNLMLYVYFFKKIKMNSKISITVPVMLQSISLLSLGASLRNFFFSIEFEQNHK